MDPSQAGIRNGHVLAGRVGQQAIQAQVAHLDSTSDPVAGSQHMDRDDTLGEGPLCHALLPGQTLLQLNLNHTILLRGCVEISSAFK
jgi:hypothetical protein